MSTKVKCTRCPQILTVPDDAVNKKVRCTKCGTTFKVEQWLIKATKQALGTEDVANVTDVPDRGPSGNFLLTVIVVLAIAGISAGILYFVIL